MVIAEEIFRSTLHLTAPWVISSLLFAEGERKLEIWIDFFEGAKFPCPVCNSLDCGVHDKTTRTWRHLDFFEYQTLIHARIPRIKCPECGVKQVNVPWARERNGFTLLMEALIVFFATTMQISQISEKLNKPDKKIWRIVAYHVQDALKRADYSSLNSVGLDETSRKKGHQYITVFADLVSGSIIVSCICFYNNHINTLVQRRHLVRTRSIYGNIRIIILILYAAHFIHICSGKDSSVLKSFSESLKTHCGDPNQITTFCSDMSPAFIKGIFTEFPHSSIVFDKLHVIKLVNEAVDEVRRIEQQRNRVVKNTRYI